MKRLLKLAEKIKDKELREKVIDVLKNPYLTNKKLDEYPRADVEKMPASLNFHHVYEGGHIDHTYAVTLLCIRIAETLKEVYSTEIDMDTLIAAALVHDFGKAWTMIKDKGWQSTGLTIDHTMLGVAELYARNFPEKVIHAVAAHFGPNGPTPPQTIEAVILHFADNFDAGINAINQQDVLKLLMQQSE